MSDHLRDSSRDSRWRVEKTSLIAIVMQKLREMSAENGLVPGSRLPSERELCQSLGVGRSTVREALRAMEALGVVELRQGKGAYLLPRAPESVGAPVVTALDDLERVVEARLGIETVAAALAASRRTEADILAMQRELDRFRAATSAGDLSEVVLADVAFHAAVVTVANPVLAFALDSFGTLVINSRQMSLSNRNRHPAVLRRHEEIYEAIVVGSPEQASRAMANHLADFVEELGMSVRNIGVGVRTVSNQPGQSRRQERLETASELKPSSHRDGIRDRTDQNSDRDESRTTAPSTLQFSSRKRPTRAREGGYQRGATEQ